MKKSFSSLFIVFFICSGFLYSEELKVAAVQLQINDYTYSSYDRFRYEMETHVKEAVNTFNPDLIIFPEYTSVFPAITPFYEYLQQGGTIEDIFYRINRSNENICSIKDIFMEEAGNVENLLSFWGELSKKYDVAIVGGSYFASHDGDLTNRLVVYGPEGERIYEQDKFFLTDFETDIIDLTEGSPENQGGFILKGKQIVLTICRDTFLRRWETMYDGADLWIDIKANGVAFTEDQKELFSLALPARMKEVTVRYGVTVCLTGSFLEFLWEGESSFIKNIDDSVHTFIRSEKVLSNEILFFIVD